jgi:hypothetical protein
VVVRSGGRSGSSTATITNEIKVATMTDTKESLPRSRAPSTIRVPSRKASKTTVRQRMSNGTRRTVLTYRRRLGSTRT